jgi:dCTP deaminase
MNTGSVLTGDEITAALQRGDIEIDPYDASQVNPASYDLRLGDGVAVYNDWVYTVEEAMSPSCGGRLSAYDHKTPLSVKVEPRVTRYVIGEDGFILKPGIGYLMHTLERVHTEKYVPVLDGKSSIGRLFIQVHATAGYGDAGFDGQYTLEVLVAHPVRVYAGMRVAQIRFHTMQGKVRLYHGNYTGEAARGAVPSRAWRQFR